jgi:hypothetical protein
VEALEAAWDLCLRKPGGAVVWVHGPHPVELSSPGGLAQRFRRRPADQGGVRLFSLGLIPGPNRIAESLDNASGYIEVNPLASWEETLRYVLGSLRSQDVIREYRLNEGGGTEALSGPGVVSSATTSRHLVRLAVFDRVRQLARSVNKDDLRKAADLAVHTRLVTPVSGAVVLEQDSQYARYGLDPYADEEAIPAIPEPEEWALMTIALLALVVLYMRRHPIRWARGTA